MPNLDTRYRPNMERLLQDLETLSYNPHGATMFLVDSQETRYPVHSIASERCDFLGAMTRNTWRESTKGEVILAEEDPEDVKHLHQFLHTGRYTLGGCDVQDEQESDSDREDLASFYGSSVETQSRQDHGHLTRASLLRGSPPRARKGSLPYILPTPLQSPSQETSQPASSVNLPQDAPEAEGEREPEVVTHAYMYAMGERLCSNCLMEYAKDSFKEALEKAVHEEDFESVLAALELIYDPERCKTNRDSRFLLHGDNLTLHKLFIGNVYRRNPWIKHWKCIRQAASRLPELAEHLEKVHRGVPIDPAHVKRT